MTGMDPVLNRRITSIFLNEYESFKRIFASLPSLEELDQLQFLLHKIKPSLVIFELDSLLKKYEQFLDIKKTGGSIEADDLSFRDTIDQTDAKIRMVKEFLNNLP